MRVRYQYVNMPTWAAECDLTKRKAENLFNKLKEAGLCMWAELVGEDDDDYMEIIDSFDKTKEARMIALIMGGLRV